MTETTIDEPTDVTTPEPNPIDRPQLPTTPRELLLSTYHAHTIETAERILGDFDRYGFELARKAPLNAEQRARAEALRTARGLVEGRTPISTAALTPIQTSELVPLARFILTGSEYTGHGETDAFLVAASRASRSTDQEDAISRRDAEDRAAQLADDPAQAQAVMARALRNGDLTLANAIADVVHTQAQTEDGCPGGC